jgi:hypothetical protein
MTVPSPDREVLRLLRRLSVKGARLTAITPGGWRLDGRAVPRGSEAAAIEAARARGLLVSGGDGTLVLAASGKALLRRSLSSAADYGAQHQDRGIAYVTDESGGHRVVVNRDESPLSWLRHRRDRDGRPLVDALEYEAGERLRVDYSRGRIMPRVTANWTAAVASGSRAGGMAEITEVAMAARLRVERALTAVGPELAGLLVDFCCFLKGLEEIERERRWPARSAKVALRLGLAALARHYGLGREARGRDRAPATLHWGSVDYRPTID